MDSNLYEHGRCAGCLEQYPAKDLTKHTDGKNYCPTCYLEASGN